MEKIRIANAENNFCLAEFSSNVTDYYFGYYDFHEYPYNRFPIRADYIEYRNGNLSFGRLSSTAAQRCVSIFLFESSREIRLASTCHKKIFVLSKPEKFISQKYAYTDANNFEIGKQITFQEFFFSYPTLFTKSKNITKRTAVITDSVNLFESIWAIKIANHEDFILIQSI